MTLELVRNITNIPIIEMNIHGKTHLFIIDTGAQGTLLSRELVGNREISGMQVLGGVGGGERSPVVLVNFKLLGVAIDKINITSIFDDFKRELGIVISGLIGQDVLQQFSSITIDNRKKRITFNK